MPKSVSKKVVSTQVSLELNPLNATMRSAMRSGLLAKSLRKTAPLMVASAAVVGSAVWAPDATKQALDRLTQLIASEAAAAIDVTATSTAISSNPVVSPVPDAPNKTISLNLTTNSGETPDDTPEVLLTNTSAGSRLSSTVDIGVLESTDYGTLNLTVSDNWDTTFTLGAETYTLVNVTGGSNSTGVANIGGTGGQIKVSGNNDTLTVNNSGTTEWINVTRNDKNLTVRNTANVTANVTIAHNLDTVTFFNEGRVAEGVLATSAAAGNQINIQNNATGTIIDGSQTHAVNVSSPAIRVNVTNSGLIIANTSIASEDQGSAVYLTGSGQVKVDNLSGGRITGDFAGVQVYSVGNITGIVNSVPTVDITNAGTIVGDVGIYIDTVKSHPTISPTGGVLITNSAGGVIQGNNGVGVSIRGATGNVEVVNRGNITAGGVLPSSSQVSQALVPEYMLRTDADDDGGDPIYSAPGAAIAVHRGLSRLVPENNNQSVTATGLTVNNEGGNIVGQGDGFHAIYAEVHGPISITTSGLIQGNNATALQLTSLQGQPATESISVTVNNGGLIQDASALSSKKVIELNSNHSAVVTINSGGTIIGGIKIDAIATATLTNEGTWYVSGVTGEDASVGGFNASASSVTINNTGNGRIAVVGNSTIAGVNTFRNFGGTIDLTADQNSTNTRLTIDFESSTFEGQTVGANAESKVFVNANLSGSTTLSNLASDSIFLNSGNATGITKVTVFDTQSNVSGVNDPFGVTVVRAGNAASEPGAFTLASGPVNKGLWQYDLFSAKVDSGLNSFDREDLYFGLDESGEDRVWQLASSPSNQAHELPVLQSLAQETWHQSATAWLDHTNNVRMRLDGGNAIKGGAWARVVGADIERKNTNRYTQSVYNQVVTQQNDYNQDVYGVMFGADGAIDTANGGTWLLGLTGGVVQSKVDFTTSTTRMDYTAGSVGAYASFVRGGGFFSALLKGDIGSTDYKMSNGNGITANESFKTNAIGLMLDGGYRFRSGIAFLEPSLSVAAVNTDVKDKEFLATRVNFSTGNSLRSKLTLATGFSAAIGGTRWEPYLALSAVNEADGENDVQLTSGGASAVKLQDRQVETYGQVALGLKVVGSKGSSGFLKVEHAPSKSDNDVAQGDAKREATTVSAGVKLTW